VHLRGIKRIGARDFRSGSRCTAIWSATIARITDHRGLFVTNEDETFQLEQDEVAIIKASWQPSEMLSPEINVHQHIERALQADREAGRPIDPEIALPRSLGIVSDSSGLESLGVESFSHWRTRGKEPDDELEPCLFMTKSFQAAPAFTLDLSPIELSEVYRKLFKTLKYLGSIGIRHRDLSPGNILVDVKNRERCLLVDFDFSRIASGWLDGVIREKIRIGSGRLAWMIANLELLDICLPPFKRPEILGVVCSRRMSSWRSTKRS
jgi:serine/threonine protein kinase